jgi:hypothetical protein
MESFLILIGFAVRILFKVWLVREFLLLGTTKTNIEQAKDQG